MFPQRTFNTWLARFRHIDADPLEMTLVGVASDAHPAESIVDMPLVGPGLTKNDIRLIQVRFVPSTGRVLRAQTLGPITASAPDLIYAEIRDDSNEFTTWTVMGFELPAGASELGVVEGTVLDRAQWDALGLDQSQQVGAVQWWPHNGQIIQIYVAPVMRRRRVGSKLSAIAECINRSRGGPPVRGGGERTELGEAFVSAAPDYAHRVAALSTVRPPMTPPDKTDGIPSRNLNVEP
ncbi:MAG: hypothetical protein JWN61_2605 [Pseudonocardiales bacterium]|nr:hypothetical protein [Pseudonocardiales bacterium]